MKLSLSKYGWRCVLGGEIIYASCMAYGLFLTGAKAQLHISLFELLPFFAWGNVWSIIFGAIFVFVASWIIAAYMVWMYNSSIVHTHS